MVGRVEQGHRIAGDQTRQEPCSGGVRGRLGPGTERACNRVAAPARTMANSALDLFFDECSSVLDPRYAAHSVDSVHSRPHDARTDPTPSVDSYDATVSHDHISAVVAGTNPTGADLSADGVVPGPPPGIEVGSVGQVGRYRDLVSGSEVVRDDRQRSVSCSGTCPEYPPLSGFGWHRSPPGSWREGSEV